MGIFEALTTSVAGLQAQSYALQNISGNIANSQTVGYKETDTNFADLVAAATQQQESASGVVAGAVATNTVAGQVQSASSSTDMAINGDGWFVVAQPTTGSDGQAESNGVQYYTRAGDFQLNDSGNLVNGSGYYLMGMQLNPATGTPTNSIPQTLQFNNSLTPAQATTQINYQANLPATPPSLLDTSDFEANPLAGAPTAAAIQGTGSTLQPDAAAVGKSTLSGLSTSTTLSSLGVAAGNTITVSDGTNTTTYTSTGSDTVGDLINAVNGGSAAVTASITGGQLVLTGNNDTASITVGGNAAADIGFGTGQNAFQPTNLLTQNAVAAGQTLTVTVGSGTTQTITFGTGTGQVATLAQLQTQLAALTGVTGTVNTSDGDITLTATDPTATINIGGTASAAEFGIHTLVATPANGTVIGNDVSTFSAQSVDGGSITAYDSQGNPVAVDFRWAKVSTATNGGTDSWQLFYQSNSNATGTESAWQNVGTTFTFNSSGQLTPPLSSLTLRNLTVNGDSLGNVQLQLGSSGLTQFASTNGTAQVNEIQQNGFAAGQLQSLAVNSNNQIVGTFSNGQTIALADIPLASFNGQDALQSVNGSAYLATADSGSPTYGATGKVVGSSLESSNVDISTQFSQLIVAQQAYSANARVMTTADQMIQTLLQVIQ